MGKEKRVEERKYLGLLSFYGWFIDNYQVKLLMSTGRPLKATTARTYADDMRKIMKFSQEVYKVDYETVNIDFYNDFINWLYEHNYSTNYVGTNIKILKTIMNISFELGHHQSVEQNRRYFKKPKAEVFSIFIDEQELFKMNELDILNMPKFYRSGVKYEEEHLAGLDIKNSQPFFLIILLEGIINIKVKELLN